MDDPRAARAAEMYRAGVRVSDIQRALRCDANKIQRWAAAAGVPLRGTGRVGIPLDRPSRVSAVAMYAEGVRMRDIAAETGHSGTSVRQWAMDEGIPARGYGWPDAPNKGLLTWDEVIAPGSGDWDIHTICAHWDERTAAMEREILGRYSARLAA